MTKQAKFVFRVLLVLLLLVFATGCDIIQKEDAGQPTDFKRGEAGLVMGFLQNYPGNSYLVTDDADREKISVVIEIRNKGTYHPSEEKIPTFREYYVFKVPGEITDAELGTKLEDANYGGEYLKLLKGEFDPYGFYKGDDLSVHDDADKRKKFIEKFMEKQSELPGSIYISGFDDDIIDITGLDEEDRKKLKPKVEGLVVDKTFEWFWSDDATTSTKGISSIVGLLGGKYKDDLEKKWDDEISKIEDSNAEKQKELRIAKLTEEVLRLKQMQEKSKNLTRMFLPAASPINPLGGIDTVDFDGEIVSNKITVDEYNPTILATLCYPYATKASPTVCVDPQPFDDKQEKVCSIGGQTLEIQGAPVAVTKIEQEASTNKIQFKIYVSNLGSGDVIKTGDSNNKEKGSSTVPTLDRCSPLGGGVLDRKDFDRVQLKKVQIGDVDLLKDNKCSPFADGTKGTDNLIRLFNGEGFVICTLEVPKLGDIQSAYTTPLNIELRYNYRSTISKNIKISKLTTI